MNIVTLQQVKDYLGVTYSSRDAYLTALTEDIEAAIFAYLNASTKAEVIARVPAELSGQAEAILVGGVRLCLNPRMRDSSYDIWKGGVLARMLLPYRVPAIGTGSTS